MVVTVIGAVNPEVSESNNTCIDLLYMTKAVENTIKPKPAITGFS